MSTVRFFTLLARRQSSASNTPQDPLPAGVAVDLGAELQRLAGGMGPVGTGVQDRPQ